MGILAGTEIESIDALRTARADPERIVECIDGIVGKGVADMRFQPQEAEADADVAMRLAEALLGINRHDCFTRAVHVLERVRETVKSGPHARLQRALARTHGERTHPLRPRPPGDGRCPFRASASTRTM